MYKNNAKYIEPFMFKKGQSGNPSGRPKTKHLSKLLLDALESIPVDKNGKKLNKTYQDLLIDRILTDAIKKGNPALINMIMKYIDGLPSIPIDLTSGGEKIQDPNNKERIVEIAKRISEQLKKDKTKS